MDRYFGICFNLLQIIMLSSFSLKNDNCFWRGLFCAGRAISIIAANKSLSRPGHLVILPLLQTSPGPASHWSTPLTLASHWLRSDEIPITNMDHKKATVWWPAWLWGQHYLLLLIPSFICLKWALRGGRLCLTKSYRQKIGARVYLIHQYPSSIFLYGICK